MRSRWRHRLITGSAVTLSFVASAADAKTHPLQAPQLPVPKQLSIEPLRELDVTLPSRRPASVMDAPAAIIVVTRVDLRRQGAASLPEALRHVPGRYVGRFADHIEFISPTSSLLTCLERAVHARFRVAF